MTGAGIAIRINKSAPGRIVISALEIIEPGAYGTLLAAGPFLAPSRRRRTAAQIRKAWGFTDTAVFIWR